MTWKRSGNAARTPGDALALPRASGAHLPHSRSSSHRRPQRRGQSCETESAPSSSTCVPAANAAETPLRESHCRSPHFRPVRQAFITGKCRRIDGIEKAIGVADHSMEKERPPARIVSVTTSYAGGALQRAGAPVQEWRAHGRDGQRRPHQNEKGSAKLRNDPSCECWRPLLRGRGR